MSIISDQLVKILRELIDEELNTSRINRVIESRIEKEVDSKCDDWLDSLDWVEIIDRRLRVEVDKLDWIELMNRVVSEIDMDELVADVDWVSERVVARLENRLATERFAKKLIRVLATEPI